MKPAVKPAVKLAQLAIAFEQAHAVFFPAGAIEMAELGSAVMAEEGIGFLDFSGRPRDHMHDVPAFFAQPKRRRATLLRVLPRVPSNAVSWLAWRPSPNADRPTLRNSGGMRSVASLRWRSGITFANPTPSRCRKLP